MNALLLIAVLLTAGAPAASGDRDEATVRSRLDARHGGAVLRWDTARAVPVSLSRLSVETPDGTSEQRARSFIADHGDVLAGVRNPDLILARQARWHGGEVVRFQQTLAGLPVEERFVVVKLDPAGRVKSVRTQYTPLTLISQVSPDGSATRDIGIEGARTAAAEAVEATAGTPTKVVLAAANGVATIAYRVPTATGPLMNNKLVWVDAQTGELLRVRQAGVR